MRIGFDIQALQSGSKHGGIGRYCYNLLKELFIQYSEHQYFLFSNGLYDKEDIPFPVISNVFHDPVKYSPGHDLNPVNGSIQHLHYRSRPLDLLHILSPIEFRRTTVISGKGLLGKTVVTLYDLIPLLFQDLYLSSEETRNEYYDRLKLVAAADLILTISESSRKDAINFLGIPSEKIITIGCSISDDFHHIGTPDPLLLLEIERKYGIKGNFIFNLGSIDIRKNQKGLIAAFLNLPEELLTRYTLVFACNYTPEATSDLRNFAEKQGGGRVTFLHFASDQEVNLLYNLCDLFVMPSFYEGFGLPVLEAMRCGAPVIASNNSSIPEITGRTDNLFDPRDTTSMTRLMVEVLTNRNYQEDLRRYGMERSKEFSWEKVARRAMESYEHYSAEQRERVRISKKKTILGVVTTWNTRCGIATYSKYLLHHLSKDITVRVFANKDCELNGPDEKYVARCWERGWNAGDLRQLLEEIIKQEVQIVHIQFNFGFFGVKELGDLILELKKRNIRVLLTFHSTAPAEICGSLQSLESISVELRCTDKVLVHSAKDRDRLKTFNVTQNVILFPHGMSLFDDESRYTLRKASGISSSKIVASFGFLLPHKGILELIESFRYLVNQYTDILLLLVCALYPNPVSNGYLEQCAKRVEELGLQKHIRFFTDFFDERAVIKLLHLADMLVFPYKETNESASGAMRFALGARRPIITSSNPIFDDFTHEVHQVKSADPREIADGIRYLYENKEEYGKLLTSIIAKAEGDRWDVVARRYKNILKDVHTNKSINMEFECLNLIDDISKDIPTLDSDDQLQAMDLLPNEIYQIYKANLSNQ